MLSSFVCKMLNKPLFCCNQVDGTNKNLIFVKGISERLKVIQLPWKKIVEFYDRDLFYIKIGSIEYKILQDFLLRL